MTATDYNQRRVQRALDLLGADLADLEEWLDTEPAPKWELEGACQYTDPAPFYPEDRKWDSDARKVCARCPVIADCLVDALRAGEKWGVWGGMNAVDRRCLSRLLSHQTTVSAA